MFSLKGLFSNNTPSFENDINLSSIFDKDASTTYTDQELLNLYRGWVFGACDVIGDGMQGLQRNLYKTEDKIDTVQNDAMGVLSNGIIKAISIYLKTLGVAYLRKVKIGEKVIELQILRPQNIQVFEGDFGTIQYYTYSDNGSTFKFQPDEIIQFKSFNPELSLQGSSPLKAIATQMAVDIASVEYSNNFFKNGGMPSVLLKHDKRIEKNVKDKYVSKFKKLFTGNANSQGVAFLDDGVEMENVSDKLSDLDMTSSRTFTMDEILMVFRVPKPLLGKSDGVGFADRKVPGFYFEKYNLKPLAIIISDQLNKDLFDGIGYFCFEFTQDKDDLQKEWQLNLITRNEYNRLTGRPEVVDGDVYWDGTPAIAIEGTKSNETALTKSISKAINKGLLQKEFGTEEYNQRNWEIKIGRTDKFEDKASSIQKNIFASQEKQILKNLGTTKKAINSEEELFSETASKIQYDLFYTPFFVNLAEIEGGVALAEVSELSFQVDKMNKWIGENIDRMAKDIDDTTRKEMFKIIQEGNRAGLGADAIGLSVRSKFNQYNKKNGRADMTARTEVTRASGKSEEEAFEQSGVVEFKEWFTAQDERVSSQCKALHGKKLKLGETFYKIGDNAVDGPEVTYEDVSFPPLHPNCRCTLVPIVSTKNISKVRAFLKQKGIRLK